MRNPQKCLIDDYINGEDDYIKRKIEQVEDEPQTERSE